MWIQNEKVTVPSLHKQRWEGPFHGILHGPFKLEKGRPLLLWLLLWCYRSWAVSLQGLGALAARNAGRGVDVTTRECLAWVTVAVGGVGKGCRGRRRVWFQARWTPSCLRSESCLVMRFWLPIKRIKNFKYVITVYNTSRFWSHLLPLLDNNYSVWHQKGGPQNPSFFEADKRYVSSCAGCPYDVDWFSPRCPQINRFISKSISQLI